MKPDPTEKLLEAYRQHLPEPSRAKLQAVLGELPVRRHNRRWLLMAMPLMAALAVVMIIWPRLGSQQPNKPQVSSIAASVDDVVATATADSATEQQTTEGDTAAVESAAFDNSADAVPPDSFTDSF